MPDRNVFALPGLTVPTVVNPSRIPEVGMARMTGYVGSILAVGLLGCTRTCQMAPESRTVRLNWMYRTVGIDRRQTGIL
jgi:hypothetical protein